MCEIVFPDRLKALRRPSRKALTRFSHIPANHWTVWRKQHARVWTSWVRPPKRSWAFSNKDTTSTIAKASSTNNNVPINTNINASPKTQPPPKLEWILQLSYEITYNLSQIAEAAGWLATVGCYLFRDVLNYSNVILSLSKLSKKNY